MIYPESFESKIGFDRIKKQTEALCATQGAVEKLHSVAFSSDYDRVTRQLEQTYEMRTILMLESDFPDQGFVDAAPFLQKAEVEGAFLQTEEIVTLRKALSAVNDLVTFFRNREEAKYPRLRELSRGVNGFPAIINHIDSIIDRFGKVKDSASPELFEVRRTIRDREGQVSKRLHQILSQAQAQGIVESDASISIREGRAVIPVSAGNKKKLRGFVHDESATGRTVYIEPIEVVEINNELKELEYEERREVVRVLVRFTETIRPDLPEIARSDDYLTSVDLIRAKARHALANDCMLPIVNRESGLWLRNARHTLLAQALGKEGKSVVPLDLRLTPEKYILVISGPNAGGKSVCLKTVGLLQYMVQCGFLVSASESSEFGIFDSIFIDIGDEQSIDNDLSTYSSHLLNMKNILRHADDRSLVLIDEFGTGTEPVIGGAIAESVLERIEQKHCFGVITTHYSNIKYYASNAEGIINGAMTFDVHNIRPLFRLETGKPGSSFAVEIARKIGLPEEIIRSAADKAGSDHINIERQLREIARDRRYWESKRDKIRQSEKRVDELAEKYRGELETVKAERNRLLKEARLEAQRITAEANRQIEHTIRTIRESQADKEKTLIVRRQMDEFKRSLEEPSGNESAAIDRKIAQLQAREKRRSERKAERAAAPAEPPQEKIVPRTIEPGVKVRIKGQDAVGEVMSISGKKATIGFGQILTTIELSRLEAISNSEFKKVSRDVSPMTAKAATNYDPMAKRLQFSQQIDVRGMRAAEALEQVREFVDEAIMLGFNELRILHGKGTGALKEEIRNYLRTVDLVKSAKDEHEERGGAGITVVQLDF